jgi:SAM-dependent methyltransferase
MEAHSRRSLLGAGLARLMPEQLAGAEPPAAVPTPTSAWELGDDESLFRWLEPAAEELVDAAGVTARDHVLDVAAGDGNVALAAARRGARVVACDIREGAVQRGRARTDAAGADVAWVQADALGLPFDAGTFDCVLSGFGVIYVARPRDVAGELRRVARTTGRVAVTSWGSAGFMGRALDTAWRRDSGPDRARPSRWGRYETLYLLFGGATHPLEVGERALPFGADDPAEAWDLLASTPGPVGAAARTLPRSERDELRREVMEAAASVSREGALDVPYAITVAAAIDRSD